MTARVSDAQANSPSAAKVATASLIGTSIEWYDFYIYATAAGLVFGQLFFPSFDPLVSTIVAFGTYAAGSAGRPLGAVIFGHLGDRHGRKQALVVTLLMMGVATTLIGLLPTYAGIGLAAPILLVTLRFVQSLGVGGEWGGAVLMSVEHASHKRRVLFGSFPQNGSSVGLLMSSGIFAAVTALLSTQAFQAWGWRIPFLVSILLVGVGLFVRLRITESPSFRRIEEANERAKLPVAEVLRTAWRPVLLTAGAAYVTIGGFYLASTFMYVYVPQETGMSDAAVLSASTITAVVSIVAVVAGGWLGDKFGARRVFALGLIITIAASFPMFWLINTGSYAGLALGMSLVMLGSGFSFGTLSTLVSQWFRARVRYSGISLGYQLSGVAGGGLTPVIATSLYAAFGQSYVPAALFLIGMCVLSLACSYAYRGRQHIDDENTEAVTTSPSETPTGATEAVGSQPPRTRGT